ncbi:cyclic pyranopterin monophosphate synthase MoaC [Syntrophotalea acetylenica]|uniref:Cyclic pyranopterin monophosphate synthase n=1 Tax=Syntrophotalea acetylenica TaxID=29542 RepID=A0A1L3GGG2_SYNAC|nr:cyclic pyranopterin monophosphate synthase MoaC [Syntrophotalea acetylenica]APG25007.1 molybdenum cofactor biosynthesis protein C [Syntrophotalea acetylenica]APG43075.1 cyclic pyranopterin monophosphate synthase accessory protein [Syntrophotalea acetylenica]MDY0261005.1 cyclic pyranopterin monophosphate synthase MoaC [Syntrophotalea acetylenica]
MNEGLTHLDENGKAIMVDVGEKNATGRLAIARGEVRMKESTLKLIMSGEMAKGDVWAVARVAGIMAAKKTPDLIPLCHPLLLSSVSVDFTPHPGQGRVEIEARVRVTGQTGVEMEALMAVAVAGLAIYDMCKAVDKEMVVSEIRLMEKHGGKSGTFLRQE